jgi:hypothetical protein
VSISPRASLRRRLTIGTVIVIAAAHLLAAFLLIALERERARESLVDALQSDARIIVENIAAALLFNDREAAAETVRSLGVQRGVNARAYTTAARSCLPRISLPARASRRRDPMGPRFCRT